MMQKTPRRTRGTIAAIHTDPAGSPTVEMLTDPDHFGHRDTVTVTHDDLRKGMLNYSYAQTFHTSQGGTWRRAYILSDRGRITHRLSAYTAQTRSQLVSRWYGWKRGDDETREQVIASLGQAISRDQREHVAVEYLDPDARAELLEEARSQHQAMVVNVITASTPMTKGQEAMLRDFGVAPQAWTWLYASARLDMLQGYPVPGTTAETWLRDHGSTPQHATALVTQALKEGGHDLENLLRSATPEQRLVADTQVARMVIAAQHQRRFYTEPEIADLRSRSVLQQLITPALKADEDDITSTRRTIRSDDRSNDLRRT